MNSNRLLLIRKPGIFQKVSNLVQGDNMNKRSFAHWHDKTNLGDEPQCNVDLVKELLVDSDNYLQMR